MADTNEKNETIPMTEDELNEILKIRRQKLADLQEAGNDPFAVVKFDKTHCSEQILSAFDALDGKTVRIAGERDLGISVECGRGVPRESGTGIKKLAAALTQTAD